MTLALIVWFVMTVIPALKAANAAVTIAFCATGVVCGLVWLITEGKFPAPIKYWIKQLKWSIPLLMFLAMIPNKETAWYMVGAYAAETVVTSETAGEVGTAAKDMMVELMNKARSELKDLSKEEIKAGVVSIKEVAK